MADQYIHQPPLTSADIASLIARIERSKNRLICASDVYGRVRDAVYGGGFGIAYRVVECTWLEDGQVLLGPSEAGVMDVPMPTFTFGGHAEAPAGEAGA